MAADEMKVWQDYYDKKAAGELLGLTNIFKNQFDITDPLAAEEVAYRFGLALVAFREMPKNSSIEQYNRDVLPLLVKAYSRLHAFTGGSWDPKAAAQADLSWWVARRDPATSSPLAVAEKMEHLYTILFGKRDKGHFIRAAYLRALAAYYRDLCKYRWGGIQSNDWKAIDGLLQSSYLELKEGIQANGG